MAIKYDPQFFVYTSDATPFPLEGVKPLFDRLLRGSKPIVLFVHGRGKEPGKSLKGTGLLLREVAHIEGHAVKKLEDYGPAAVLFSWDSKRGRGFKDRERPLSNTPEGARRFASVLDKLSESLAGAPASHPPVTLLAHSMGTIVVERYVEQNGGWRSPGQGPLFSNVVLSSADADNIGHPVWVDKIASVERVFVTVNPMDPTLEDSVEARQPNAVALGRNPGPPLSNTATYAMLEVKAHEIFTKRPEHPEISNFFAAAFSGNVPAGEALPAPGHRIRLR
jgi:pimeloyl-ACP methyl ester carboxylesterase